MDGTLRIAKRSPDGNLFGRGLLQLAGWVAGGCAVVVAAVLAVIFAASVLVIAVMASALIAFAGMALRARRTAGAPVRAGQYLETRKVGHSWVAYSWDRR